MDVADLKAKIRDIKNFPTEGILFKDITTLLKDGPAFRYVVDTFVRRTSKSGSTWWWPSNRGASSSAARLPIS